MAPQQAPALKKTPMPAHVYFHWPAIRIVLFKRLKCKHIVAPSDRVNVKLRIQFSARIIINFNDLQCAIAVSVQCANQILFWSHYADHKRASWRSNLNLNRLASRLNELQQNGRLRGVKAEFAAHQHPSILGQDAFIKADQRAARQYAPQDCRRSALGRQQARHQNIGVEDDLQPAFRPLRNVWTSPSTSPMVSRSRPRRAAPR